MLDDETRELVQGTAANGLPAVFDLKTNKLRAFARSILIPNGLFSSTVNRVDSREYNRAPRRQALRKR